MNTNERSLTYKKIMPLILVYAVMVGLSIVANFLNPGFLNLDDCSSDVISGNRLHRVDPGDSHGRY